MIFYLIFALCITGHLAQAEEEHGPASIALPVTTPEALVATKPPVSAGLSCYVCNSNNDTSCFDEKNLRKEHLQKCEAREGHPAVGCWRMEQWVAYDESEDLKSHDRVIRGCAYRKQDHACIKRGGFGGMVVHCQCNSTACNGSMSIIQPKNTFIVFLTSFLCILTLKIFA